MRTVSEPETTFRGQIDQTLEALPAVGRWLSRSASRRPQNGKAPPSLGQVRVLIQLFQRGPQTMGELARGLGISCSAATECVAGLEERGAVLRNRGEADRRQVVVSMTPAAKAVAAQVLTQRKVVVERVLRRLSASEGRAFVKGMALLADAAELWMDQAASVRHGSASEAEAARA